MDTASLLLDVEVAAQLPGEPAGEPASWLGLRALARAALLFFVLAPLTAPLWLPFLLGVLIWGYPPNVPAPSQALRYLRYAASAPMERPRRGLAYRAWLLLSVLRKVFVTPIWGLAWMLDELLYGAALDRTPVTAPLIKISAARSGSTQLSRYIEDDPELVAPMVIQAIFPYLWLWKLAPHTLGRLITMAQAQEKLEASFPEAFIQRHEGQLDRTDTFEGALFIGHLNHLAPLMGAEVFAAEFSLGVAAPHNKALWEQTFPDLLDRIARKTLLHAGPLPDGRAPRFFVKGHFLAAAGALAQRYPDARFLTMIREPAPRLRSAVNFLRANPLDPALGCPPWAWLGRALSQTESIYCEAEQDWFSAPLGPRRCVLRFSEYVEDLEGAMTRVYAECLDKDSLPPHVPREHAPRERTNYILNRTLAEVGVDEAALNARLSGYIAWCRGEG